MRNIQTADLPSRDESERLGVTADALDRFDLMRAIERCDELIGQLQALQLLHSQNLCRVANRLAASADLMAERMDDWRFGRQDADLADQL